MFPSNTRILVVDDSANIRKIISDSLRKKGYTEIESAADASLAFIKIDEKTDTDEMYQLIMSDLNMPGLSGIEFLKQVRNHALIGDIPFILITTESEKGAVLEAAVSGVSSYIVKPFDIETIGRKLAEAWDKHGAHFFSTKVE